MQRHARCAITVITKEPHAGQANTRPSPPLTPQQAAALSAAILRDAIANIGIAAASAYLGAARHCLDHRQGNPADVGTGGGGPGGGAASGMVRRRRCGIAVPAGQQPDRSARCAIRGAGHAGLAGGESYGARRRQRCSQCKNPCPPLGEGEAGRLLAHNLPPQLPCLAARIAYDVAVRIENHCRAICH
jgi:hypothetical protein